MKNLMMIFASLALSTGFASQVYAMDYLRADVQLGERHRHHERREYAEDRAYGGRAWQGGRYDTAPRVIYYATPSVNYAAPNNSIHYNGVDNYGTTTIYYSTLRVLPSVSTTRYQVQAYDYDKPHVWRDPFARPRGWSQHNKFDDERRCERRDDRD